MQLPSRLHRIAASSLLVVAMAASSVAFARDYEQCSGEHEHMSFREMSPQDRMQWVKARLDREAAILEIKASQESAWEGYTSAALELMAAIGARKPLSADTDAATAVRQHAERAAAMAQGLAKLADATEKLQSVLNEDQRKVLDRIVRRHSHFFGRHQGEGMNGHERWHHGDGSACDAHKLPARPAASSKVKN